MAAAAQIEIAEFRASRFTPEFDLLCACCRGLTASSLIGILLQHSLNWEHVLRQAGQHRVLPAVSMALRNRTDFPASIRSAIGARFVSHERRVLRFSAELVGILHQFDSHGIPVIPYKGPILSQLLYGDPAMRDFGDLDLLVLPQDVPRARAALLELGFEQKLSVSPRCEREFLRSGYELVFGSKTERNLVELHWQVLPHFYAVPFDTETIFARSREIEFAGSRLRVPCNEDALLILCVHAAKHEWSQLGMVRDVATLAGMDLDWRWIAAESRRLGITKMLLISLLLACDLLAFELPEALTASALEPECENLATQLSFRLAHGETLDVESPRYFQFMMKLLERRRDRVRFLWRLISTPSVSEWETITLPDMLFPLYRGVRVLRLARRFARGKRAQVRPTRT